MLCQNCGKNEANVRYTQIINGVKKEIRLCTKCAKELGVGSFEFNMPINFANFLGDFFGTDYSTDMLPSFVKEDNKICKNCSESYEEFMQTGLLGCPECYNMFEDKLDPILKKLQGSVKHNGRGINGKVKKIKNTQINDNTNIEESKESVKINKLNEDLKQAIKDERYEDAARLRDEIKKLNEEGNDKNV